MTKETIKANETISATSDDISQLINLMSAVDEDKVNAVPYEGSWTAPQLLRHVTMAINGMTKALHKDAKPAERNPWERIEELKNIFLDFSKKYSPPESIVPEEQIYEKQSSIEELNQAFNQFKESTVHAKLNDLIEGLPFGPVTKLEIIYFVLYHTQRHLHQMQKICDALMSPVKIQEICASQNQIYKTFFKVGLIEDAEYFRITADDDAGAPFPTKDLSDSFTLGAYVGQDLAAIVSFERDGNNREKLRHKGTLFRMYVSKHYRGKGFSKLLIDEVIKRGRLLENMEQINLTVITTNKLAKRLYEKYGFKTFGIEKNSIKWKNCYFTEEQMVLFL